MSEKFESDKWNNEDSPDVKIHNAIITLENEAERILGHAWSDREDLKIPYKNRKSPWDQVRELVSRGKSLEARGEFELKEDEKQYLLKLADKAESLYNEREEKEPGQGMWGKK